MEEKDQFLTPEQINEFRENGILVVKGVVSREEVEQAREEYHQMLFEVANVDINNLRETYQNLIPFQKLCSGGISNFYYAHWKLRLNENVNIYRAVS